MHQVGMVDDQRWKKSRDKLFSIHDFEPSAIGTEIPKFMVFHFLARFGRVAWPIRDKHIQKGGGGNIRDFKRNNTL